MSVKKASDGSSLLWSIVVLVACLSFVYMIFFAIEKPSDVDAQVENDVYVEDQNEGVDDQYSDNQIELTQIQIAEDSGIQINDSDNTEVNTVTSVTTKNDQPTQTGPVVEQGKTFFSVQDLFAEVHENTDGMIPLSGTFLWEGSLRSLVDFGLIGQEEYVLKTVQNSHFAYLGSFDSESIPLLDQMGGNVVEITDKNSIQEHSLYGDRIRFLNTERYKDLEKVIYIVFFDQTDDAWFVQMDRDHYYKSKPSTQALFDPWYDW